MSSRVTAAVLFLLPLTACGSGETRNTATTANATGEYIERMQALNEKERNAVLFRAIRDAQRPCQRVERSVAIDPVQGKPAWIATCDDNSPWLVTLAADGTATVSDARTAAGATKG